MSYGFESWGYHKGSYIEKIHLDFLIYIVGVRRNTNKVMLYIETSCMLCTSNFFNVYLDIDSNCYKQAIVFRKLSMIFHIANVKDQIKFSGL